MFYDTFLSLCSEKGMKPGRVADEIGINRATVTSWKKRGYTPRAEVLHKIADYFGVTVDYLLGKVDLPFLSKDEKGLLGIDSYALTETKKPAPTDGDGPTLDASLIERLIQLTPEEREKVEVFVQGMIAGRDAHGSR